MPNWHVAYDGSGQRYYWNTDTREVQWEEPTGDWQSELCRLNYITNSAL